MKTPMCLNCRFYRKGHLAGTCRHNPPTPDPVNVFAVWPKVDTSEWCGKHEPKQEAKP